MKSALTAMAKDSPTPPTLVSAASKARVQKVVAEALSAGAEIIHGSVESKDETHQESGTGVHIAPVILGKPNEDMTLWQDELFAPLAALVTVESDDEAVSIANKTGYGLSASVFTEDLRKGFALAKRIESGYVYTKVCVWQWLMFRRAVHINSMSVHDEPVLPHGGVKNSGWGRFNSSNGIEEFLATKSVTWKD
jgi:acyl-CoA reductase-like NAD-dependent aldehyde dehydrogenase